MPVTWRYHSGFGVGLGLLSLGSSSATYLGGQSLGLANQVAMSVAGGVTGAAEAGIRTSAEAARYAALVTYDVGRAGTRVVINQAQSGAVLGYNALTQIPVQLFMGTFTGAIFLVEEGSTLKVVRATDKPSADGASKAGPTLSYLPVGTVVDMQKLKERKDIEIEVVTDDPEVTHKVLEQVQQDARAP